MAGDTISDRRGARGHSAIAVTFTQPGVAERAMYFGTPIFNAGTSRRTARR